MKVVNLDHFKNKICREVVKISRTLFAVSDFLLEHPETAFKEFKACEYLCRLLSEYGFDVEKGSGGLETAFVAKSKEFKSTRPTVAILAEYDALPGIGHGCGHNLVAAAAIGAAIALGRSLGSRIEGSLAVVGTPAEEDGGGKIRLMEAGVFRQMDAAMMFHPGNTNLQSKDSLGCVKLKMEFFGKTAHASSMSDQGRNALDAIVMAYTGINSFRQHLMADGRVHGIITHGGDAPNVIPDYTSGLFYVRAGTSAYRDEIFERVKKCARGAALATDTEVKVSIDPPKIDPIKRNIALENIVKSNMEALGKVIDKDDGRRGSSDIGNLSHYLPAIQLFLAVVDSDSGIPGHSVAFREATASPRGRETLLNGSKVLAMTAWDFLTSKELRTKVAEDFKKQSDQT